MNELRELTTEIVELGEVAWSEQETRHAMLSLRKGEGEHEKSGRKSGDCRD